MKRILTIFILLFACSQTIQSSFILVLNNHSNDLYIINAESLKLKKILKVGIEPHELWITPDGKKTYIVNSMEHSIYVIDNREFKIIKKIFSEDLSFPHGICSHRKRILVTSAGKGKIVVLDGEKDEIIGSINIDQKMPHMIAITPDEKKAYVANIESNTVSVIDIDRLSILKNIKTRVGPEGIAISPNGKEVYVACQFDKIIEVISTERDEIISSIAVEGYLPKRIAFSPDGKKAYICNMMSDTVTVVSTNNRSILKIIKAGRTPRGIAVSSDGKRIFVANDISNSISIIDGESLEKIAEIPAGFCPDGIGFLK